MSKPTTTARPQKLRFVLCDAPAVYGTKPACDTPEKIYDFYNKFIKTDSTFEAAKEHVYVICLDTRLNAIGYNLISVGTVSESNAHPREIFRPVIAAGSYGFIAIHNHPSGLASPSRADEMVTKRLVEASKLLQITFLDHVICGEPAPGRMGYYSFREAGLIP